MKRHAIWFILAAALILRLLHAAALRAGLYDQINLRFALADMQTFYQWAQAIRAGDWLGRHTYHPGFDWMTAMGSLEQWQQWWGGAHIFHQAPLYPYLLAALLTLTGGEGMGVLVLQLLLGLGVVALAWALGHLLWDRQAGLLAAALAAIYAPFVFYSGTLLRDWLGPLIDPLLLLAVLLALRAGRLDAGWFTGPRAQKLAWMFAGAAWGLALLLKSSALAYGPLLVLLWLVVEGRDGGMWRRRSWIHAALLGAGVLVVLSPLLVRNVVVDAPWLSLSTRGIEELVEGNAVDAIPVGLYHPPSLQGVLERAQGSRIAAMRAIAEDYQGQWAIFFRQQALKASALLHPLEIPNNLSLSYGRRISPVLRVLPGYGTVLVLGLCGVVLITWLRGSAWRDPRLQALALFTLFTFAILMVALVLGRFRNTLALCWMLWAAVGWRVVVGYASVHGVRAVLWRMTLVLVVMAVLVFQVNDRVFRGLLPVDYWQVALHTPDYLLASTIHLEQGRPDRAAGQLRWLRQDARAVGARAKVVAVDLIWDEVQWRQRAARQFEMQQQPDRSADQLRLAEEAVAAGPAELAGVYFDLGMHYLDLQRPADARRCFEAFVAHDPDAFDAPLAREMLENLDN